VGSPAEDDELGSLLLLVVGAGTLVEDCVGVGTLLDAGTWALDDDVAGVVVRARLGADDVVAGATGAAPPPVVVVVPVLVAAVGCTLR
jgi:hypothetical protein